MRRDWAATADQIDLDGDVMLPAYRQVRVNLQRQRGELHQGITGAGTLDFHLFRVHRDRFADPRLLAKRHGCGFAFVTLEFITTPSFCTRNLLPTEFRLCLRKLSG